MRVTMLLVGLVLLGVGLGLGFVPTSASTTVTGSATANQRVDTYSCGSPWSVDRDSIDKQQGVDTLAANVAVVQGTLAVPENTADLCERAFGTRGTWGAVLAGLGALSLLGLGLLMAFQSGRRPAPPAPTEAAGGVS